MGHSMERPVVKAHGDGLILFVMGQECDISWFQGHIFCQPPQELQQVSFVGKMAVDPPELHACCVSEADPQQFFDVDAKLFYREGGSTEAHAKNVRSYGAEFVNLEMYDPQVLHQQAVGNEPTCSFTFKPVAAIPVTENERVSSTHFPKLARLLAEREFWIIRGEFEVCLEKQVTD